MLKDWDLHRREQWSNILHLTLCWDVLAFETFAAAAAIHDLWFGKKVIIGFGVVDMETKLQVNAIGLACFCLMRPEVQHKSKGAKLAASSVAALLLGSIQLSSWCFS